MTKLMERAIRWAVLDVSRESRAVAVTQKNADEIVRKVASYVQGVLCGRRSSETVPPLVAIVHPNRVGQLQVILAEDLLRAEKQGWTKDVDQVVQHAWPRRQLPKC